MGRRLRDSNPPPLSLDSLTVNQGVVRPIPTVSPDDGQRRTSSQRVDDWECWLVQWRTTGLKLQLLCVSVSTMGQSNGSLSIASSDARGGLA